MRRALLAIVAAAVVGAAGTAQRAEPAATAADDDVRLLMQQIRQVHPNAFHYTREATFQAAADELAGRAPSLSPDQLLVELMRFTNLLGERDGHSGIFPLDSSHRRVLHLFPLYLYKFSDGLFVVAAPRNRGLVGTKLLAVDGTAADELERQVRPLVPRDNEATRDDRFMSFMLTAEVLHGLGLRSGNRAGAAHRAEAGRGAARRDRCARHGGGVPAPDEASVPLVRLRAPAARQAALSPEARRGPLRDDARPRAGRLRQLQPHPRFDRTARAPGLE